ncbi:hypothetical protein IJH74_01450 [Candidatus Saccharibacteria bacterium]|nr:hypothetical protein [Candidatus Saccharibacteria bacterium]
MTENLFMRIIYDKTHPTNPPYFVRCPNEWYMKNPKKYPEVFTLIERLQKAIGVYTFLGIETANLHPYCDKVVLTTLLIDDVEYPQYLCTPFGTFVLIFFLKDENGILREIEPIAFIEELKEYLFLTPCLMNGNENNCEVLYIHENIEDGCFIVEENFKDYLIHV